MDQQQLQEAQAHTADMLKKKERAYEEKKKEKDKEKTTTINKKKESKVDAENGVEIKVEYEIEASR